MRRRDGSDRGKGGKSITTMRKITVAIDGHSSCGKSTMAKHLARKVGYTYVDTGAMYRAVTLFALREGLLGEDGSIREGELEGRMGGVNIGFSLDAVTGVPVTLLNGEDVEGEIRSMRISSLVSRISALPFVREALVDIQRRMGEEKGVVMDGRDIGTVVFPNAELKVFVTAAAEVRAKRRHDELVAKGMPADFGEILRNVRERDHIDSHREVSPLRKADDAVVLDNGAMTIEEQDAWLMERFLQAAR